MTDANLEALQGLLEAWHTGRLVVSNAHTEMGVSYVFVGMWAVEQLVAEGEREREEQTI